MDIKNYIITGATALYRLGYITFNPAYTTIEMENGTKTDNYNDKYKISSQAKDTIDIGVTELNGERIYMPERLYIELNKFPLENTIKNQALKNLERDVNPEIVKRYYEKLKDKRRNLDKPVIEKFLEKNLMNVKEVLVAKKHDADQVIHEYIMALLARKNVPLAIIKGGSAVELFVKNKRATQDIDLHSDRINILEIIKYLEDTKKIIYFKLTDKEKFLKELDEHPEKKIFTITVYPKTLLKIDGFDLIKGVDITINTSYSDDELHQFMQDFNIQKKNLKIFANAYALVFTKEMLIAEKYQSIIWKPEESTRTKDLIDLANLVNDDINWDDVHHWLLIKWSRAKFPKSPIEIKTIIETNKHKELVKFKENFKDANDMYATSLEFDECVVIYNKISDLILSKIK